MGRRRLLFVAVLGAPLLGMASMVGCGAILGLPDLELLSDEAGRGGQDHAAPDTPDTTNDAGGADVVGDTNVPDAPCTSVTPPADWCTKCGVGCDGATCNVYPGPCGDGGAVCCTNYQCKNGTCQACALEGGSCGGTSCCSPLRCRTVDYRCVACGKVGAPCDAVTTSTCCSNDCDIINGMCR